MTEISGLTALTAPAAGDLLVAVDVSDTTTPPAGPAGSDKNLTLSALASYVGSVTSGGSAYVSSALASGTGISTGGTTDMSGPINTWLLSLAAGTTAWFPPGNYMLSHAVEVPRDIRIAGAMYGYDTPKFVAMSGFADSQIMRNWQAQDVTNYGNSAGSFYAPGQTYWGGAAHPTTGAKGGGNNYLNITNVTLDCNGNSGVTCLAAVHIMERSFISCVTFVNTGGAAGNGNTGFALFSNNDIGTPWSAGRFIMQEFTSYGIGWQHFICIDGYNGGGTQNGTYGGGANAWGAEGCNDVDIIQFTSPVNAAGVFSDSPIWARWCRRLHLEGHQEGPPAQGTDTAAIRLVNCADVTVSNAYYFPGGSGSTNLGSYRPYIRATSDSNAGAYIPGQHAGPNLRDVTFVGAGGWSTRTDTGCTIASGSANVTDANIDTATDLYRKVQGPGIPSGTYITAVSSGSFTMSANAWLSGTVSLTICDNIIEDDSAAGGLSAGSGISRHFSSAKATVAPQRILRYTGTEMTWTQYSSSATEASKTARTLAAADDIIANFAPSGAIAESFPRAYGAPNAGAAILTSGTLHLTAVYLYPGDLVSNLSYWSGATALGTPTSYWFALFDPQLNLVAISASGQSGAWAANTQKTLAMVTPWAASVPDWHYAGICVNASQVPTIECVIQENIASAPPHMAGNSTACGGDTSTAPLTAQALTVTSPAGRPYVLVT